MNMQITVSSKGQIVIPKEIRDALRISAGQVLDARREGEQIILQAHEPQRDRISYAEYKSRIPAYDGPAVSVEDMTAKIGEIFESWKD